MLVQLGLWSGDLLHKSPMFNWAICSEVSSSSTLISTTATLDGDVNDSSPWNITLLYHNSFAVILSRSLLTIWAKYPKNKLLYPLHRAREIFKPNKGLVLEKRSTSRHQRWSIVPNESSRDFGPCDRFWTQLALRCFLLPTLPPGTALRERYVGP